MLPREVEKERRRSIIFSGNIECILAEALALRIYSGLPIMESVQGGLLAQIVQTQLGS